VVEQLRVGGHVLLVHWAGRRPTRIGAAKHYPVREPSPITDGAAAGTAIGTLVPHVHRASPVSIAAAFAGDGATLGIHGVF